MSKEKVATPTEEGMPKEVKKGTTELLFSEVVSGEDQMDEEVLEEVLEDAEKLPDDKEVPLYKVKIDGVEKEVPYEELIKGYQTAQFLSQKGQRLAEERRALEEERKRLESEKARSVQKDTEDEEDIYYKEEIKPLLEKETSVLKEEISTLKSTISELSKITGPMKYQTDLKEIDKMMRAEGLDDFMNYVEKIEERVFSASPEEQALLYSFDGYIKLYQQFKIKDMIKSNSSGVELRKADERKKPKVIPIESAGGKPSATNDTVASINAAIEEAKETGDWNKVLRLKGYG